MRYYLLLMLGLSLLVAGGCKKNAPLDPNTVQIKFGEMKKNNKGVYVVTKETTDVKIVPRSTFGINIHAPGSFTYYVVWHLASAAKRVHGSLEFSKDSASIVKTNKYKKRRFGSHYFYYTSYSDQLGAERMDVYVNDQLVKSIDFVTSWRTDANRAAYDMDAMPVGLKVVHTPGSVTKVCKREKGRLYYCYKTRITNTTNKDLTVVRFGTSGSVYDDNKKFKKWYNCPSGVIKAGKSVKDDKNWSWYTDPNRSVDNKWYFVAKDKDGKYYKGEGVVRINPKD